MTKQIKKIEKISGWIEIKGIKTRIKIALRVLVNGKFTFENWTLNIFTALNQLREEKDELSASKKEA